MDWKKIIDELAPPDQEGFWSQAVLLLDLYRAHAAQTLSPELARALDVLITKHQQPVTTRLAQLLEALFRIGTVDLDAMTADRLAAMVFAIAALTSHPAFELPQKFIDCQWLADLVLVGFLLGQESCHGMSH